MQATNKNASVSLFCEDSVLSGEFAPVLQKACVISFQLSNTTAGDTGQEGKRTRDP